MRRFIYSPDVQAYISTQDHGIVDVSADIVSGSVNRILDGASTAELVLNSPNRKYLRIFRPMDRIAIFLTRIKPVLVFTGYLDRAPIDQLYPGPITLNASCTIKRLLYTYWDPTLAYTERWFAKHGWTWDIGTGQIYSNEGKSMWNLDLQGTIGHMMRQVLHDVGNWPIGQGTENRNTVHILGLPQAFLTKTQDLISKEITANAEQRDNILKFLRALLTVDGIFSDPFNPDDPNSDAANFTSSQVDDAPLPATMAKSYHASIYGPAYAISGMAGAIKKEAAKDGISLTAEQAQNGSVVYATMIKAGFTEKSSAAWISAAYAESHLNSGSQEAGGGGGSGLFQLTSSNFFGPSGILAQVAKAAEPGYSGNPQQVGSGLGDNGAAASNPQYNVLAILHNANVSNPTQAVNGASNPLHAIVDIFLRPADPSGDYSRGGSIFPAMLRATKSATTTSGATSEANKGTIGDVKVGTKDFFTVKMLPDRTTQEVGFTFRIKDNPYGDDNMIFRAAKYDSNLDDQEVAIYVPGAKDKSSPQAALWTNKTVTIETSINKANRFPSAPGTSPGSTSITNITPPVYPLGARGDNRGAPYVGTHTNYGNWESDNATDIYIGEGTPILAIDNGTIGPQIGPLNTSDPHLEGQRLHLVTQNNEYYYAHLSRIDVVAGQKVKAGQQLGLSGSANGVQHLHLAVFAPDPWSHYKDIDKWTFVSGDKIIQGTAGTPTQGVISGANTILGGTGVSINQVTVAQIAASTSYGLGVVFPLVSNAIESASFTGERALQNDVPLIDWVKFMATASGRRFQSLPNGDFMAFYPDYFNWSNQAPYWIISDIETQDLTIDVSDEKLATHVFTTADSFSPNGQIDLDDKLASTVASIENISSFKALVGVKDDFDSGKFMQRYGARPMTEDVPEIKNSFMQFMYGWTTFLKQWAEMFFAQPTFTFMPELYPGGLVEFKSKDLVMFVNSVTHSFDRTSGFTTTAELIAPSTRSKKSNWDFPMVLTNGYATTTTSSRFVPGVTDFGR